MITKKGEASMASSHQPILPVTYLTKSYFGNVVLDGVSFDVHPGEVVALLGENGAGKSTLSGIIAGSVTPDDGSSMTWMGKPYAPESPHDAMEQGIAMIHQELRYFPDLTIAENVFAGHVPMRNGIIDRKTMNNLAAEQLVRLGMDIPVNRPMRTLRVAAQQQVEIAKALVRNARLLILDEPTAALGAQETDRLFECIEELKKTGVAFIYISHRLEEIARIADTIVVLRDGDMVATHDDPKVDTKVLITEMVGRNVERLFPALPSPSDAVALEVRNFTSSDGSFTDVSFSVREGEIFGLAGIVGAGRTELVRGITGCDPVRSGEVVVSGQKTTIKKPSDAINAGIVVIPEDRKTQGIVVSQSITDNIVYSNMDALVKGGWILPKKVAKLTSESIRLLGIKGTPKQSINALSGGNQQKVVIAKWISRKPKIIILDEPTRGIDVGARAAIYEIIVELVRNKVAVIVVSSDLDEVLGLSHRVLVLNRGRQKGILDRSDASNIKVMELATIE
ncbi:MAG: sugar ABC transporter ATP-binding protein [Planctomycetaceae bacterium]|nr:sugar ABC transporter ATP-binding protein [Planctomycetaceae bacterium]